MELRKGRGRGCAVLSVLLSLLFSLSLPTLVFIIVQYA